MNESITGLLLGMKCMKSVLLKFNKSKFALNHSFIHLKTAFMSLTKATGLGLVTNILVSTANKIVVDLLLIILGKSFIQIRNSKGPKTDLRDTPCPVLAQAETLL
jgi:hypothetical protein